MRSIRLLLLTCLAIGIAVPGVYADHFQANCPLTFVGSTTPASPFFLSPHGVFKNGTQVYLLRGQTLTTLAITDLGNVSVVREDYVSSMTNHDDQGGATYSNGFMFVSGEQGLEIFDLRNVRAGGNAPIIISRTATPHYRRLTIMGNLLAAIFPAQDYPCQADGTSHCRNQIDLYNISNLTAPVRIASIVADSRYVGFNDIVFAYGYLWTTGFGGTYAFDVTTNPASPKQVYSQSTVGSWLTTNGTSVLGIGQDTLVGVYTFATGPRLTYFAVFTLPSIFNVSNKLMFHPEAYLDDNRLITIVDERDPLTRKPARSVAFDAFDFSVPIHDGSDDRIYENVSMTFPDEVKYHPFLIGPFLNVVGEMSGTQKWGACDQIAGSCQWDVIQALPCGGAELYGAVTGKAKIASVELYLDDISLGFAKLGDERYDVTNSPMPIRSYSINVNLDSTARGEHLLRAIATDVLGNRRQFWAQKIFFPGPGENCTTRRRGAHR